jgi:hypothetical protein
VGRRSILDPGLKGKLSSKLGKPQTTINVMVSQKASKLGISSEAALILLAKQHGIGTLTYQRKLDPAKQAEVRAALPVAFAASRPKETERSKAASGVNRATSPSKKASLKLAIEYLIQDSMLLSRCRGPLMASANFDIPINQATLVLEDRIRKKAQPPSRMVGENLVNYAFHEDLSRTLLRVSGNDPDDQRGFTQILRGVVPAFRNKTHHHIADTFSREEAMRVCGFIDVLLRVVDNSTKVK